MPAAKKKKPPGKRKMVRADSARRRPVGRPTRFAPEILRAVASMAHLGMTKREICEALQLGRNTFWQWERTRPEFREAISKAIQGSDERVEASLYERAIGYEYETEKVYHYQGVPVRIPTKQHVPADPQLAIFWLKNRAPERWKDRMEVQHSHLFNFVGMLPSEQEWLSRYAPNEPVDIKSNLPAIEDKSGDEEER